MMADGVGVRQLTELQTEFPTKWLEGCVDDLLFAGLASPQGFGSAQGPAQRSSAALGTPIEGKSVRGAAKVWVVTADNEHETDQPRPKM